MKLKPLLAFDLVLECIIGEEAEMLERVDVGERELLLALRVQPVKVGHKEREARQGALCSEGVETVGNFLPAPDGGLVAVLCEVDVGLLFIFGVVFRVGIREMIEALNG